MTARTACLVLCSALPLCAIAAAGQEPQPESARFSSRTDLVVLHLSVVDRRAGLVSGLPRDAFTVYEDGRPQPIEFFLNEDTPATVGLVFDSSTSMHRKREAVIAAGMAFARSTHPRDEIFTVHFNERVRFGLSADQPFTSDPARLRAALEKTNARGQTALFDAVTAALRHVRRGTAPKRALIVVSDGGDNASRASFTELMQDVERSDALIYTVCLAEEYDRDADPKMLERLARASGAVAFTPEEVEEVPKILERVARDIHGGYTLGYVPAVSGTGRRDIRVEVSAPDGRRLSVRTRSSHGSE